MLKRRMKRKKQWKKGGVDADEDIDGDEVDIVVVDIDCMLDIVDSHRIDNLEVDMLHMAVEDNQDMHHTHHMVEQADIQDKQDDCKVEVDS